eukprot:COSAG05_NODE_7895_length_758_cov_1.034901_1_plen_156_part_01
MFLQFLFGGGVKVFARQFNPEPHTPMAADKGCGGGDEQEDESHIQVSGGSALWILGLKIEQPGPVIRVVGGSQLELFGGYLYPLINSSTAFVLRESTASLSWVVESWHPWMQTQYKLQVNESYHCGTVDSKSNHDTLITKCALTEGLWTYGAHGYP